MVDLVLGIGAAVGASTFYSLGIALQALDAREAPREEHLRVALVWGLLRRARWLAGTGLSILGWPLQVIALLLAPLVVVQPALAAGLLVLMFVAQRMLGEHAGRYEYLAMGAIAIGVIGAGLTAPPRSDSHTLRGTDDRDRAERPRDHEPAALSAARDPPLARVGDDDRCRAQLRVERCGDQARL